MAAGPNLSIDIAEKRFDPAGPALFEAFRLDIAPSSVVALLGPSGIGKSTLLRIIAGIDQEFAGKVRIDDAVSSAAPRPGFVFQDPRLLPWLSAADNVRASDPGCTWGEANAALASVGLAGKEQLFPHQLSGGMQRRVALARALAVNSRLLLLDEPFVSLDRALALEMQQLLSRLLASTQATTVFVTHLAEEAAQLADRVIVLEGRPARVVADLALSVQRKQRDAKAVRRILDSMAAAARKRSRVISS